jgi:uncharacterized membrane protein YcaP (DUF421 family)
VGEPGLWAIAGRTSIIYLMMLVVIRLLGKRTVGNLTSFDMLIALIMGDLAGTAIYGEVSLWSAIAAVSTLAALHYANSWLASDRPRLARLLEGRATVIVEHGRFVRAGLRRERMSEQEALAELRLEGIDDLEEVREARVETDGRVSVLREDGAEPLQRRDLTPARSSPGR